MPLPELFCHVIALVETNKVDHVVVERASSGTALLELLWERYGHTKRCESFLQFLHPVKPTNAKTFRMEKAMIEIEAGRVYLPVSDPRLDEFEHELLAFPNDKNDDYIDAL
jgi:predicted phage terminase large subunit-like protein